MLSGLQRTPPLHPFCLPVSALDASGWAPIGRRFSILSSPVPLPLPRFFSVHCFVAGTYSQNVSNSQGSLPKNVSWYRKHLGLPAVWERTHIDLYVEGAYSVATCK